MEPDLGGQEKRNEVNMGFVCLDQVAMEPDLGGQEKRRGSLQTRRGNRVAMEPDLGGQEKEENS